MFAVGQFVLVDKVTPSSKFIEKLCDSLNLQEVTEYFPHEIAAEIVEEAYESCLLSIYSHPFWRKIEAGELEQEQLLAYLIETRHYLYAAASRMSPSVSSACQGFGLARILTSHLIEEYDHAKYFEAALQRFGCDIALIQSARPHPATVEWTHFMRAVGAIDPLAAALSSGLLEFTARDRDAVRNWHGYIVDLGLLPREVVNEFKRHVEIDEQLGHGENWRLALRAERSISAIRLSKCLNCISAVSEMLGRWLDAILHGSSGALVYAIRDSSPDACKNINNTIDGHFTGAPLWPSSVYECIWRSNELSAVGRQHLASCFHLSDFVGDRSEGVLGKLLKLPWYEQAGDLEGSINIWMQAIDGHQLWEKMMLPGSETINSGWLIENYHYLAANSSHVASAIESCDIGKVRDMLVEHLAEERGHESILGEAIVGVSPISLDRLRPLPTTMAFTGLLKSLAREDWRAYCCGLVFLQLSLRPNDAQHHQFYERVNFNNPSSMGLLSAMKQHDEIDSALGHEGFAKDLIVLLDGRVSAQSLKKAALVPQMAWSFLDGILQHYKTGEVSIVQRLGWGG